MNMRQYAHSRSAILLQRFVFQMHRAARPHDAEAIHDLRVSIRRLQQCLIVFGQFFPHRQVKKIRRRLHEIMAIAGEIRNRDIALELLTKSGLPPGEALVSRWREETGTLRRQLAILLGRWGHRDMAQRWGSRLGL